MKEATFGAGCFWCIEACFKQLKGVIDVYPGYAGGHKNNPTYQEVCEGDTDHAEVVRIIFDETLVTFEELLKVFWFLHDPTQLNRQGEDIGTQYRSVIFYHDANQMDKALFYKQKLEEEKLWNNPIVTEIVPLSNFYPAEDYHKDYFNRNPENSYCNFVVKPKIEKFQKVFENKLSH